MLRRVMTPAVLAACLVTAVFVEPGISSPQKSRVAWPKKHGAYVAKSSESIPAFPRTLSGYRSKPNKDFWGESFNSRGALRLFAGKGWTMIEDFPYTQNGCSAGVFMLRWRADHPGTRVASHVGYSQDVTYGPAKIGSFGYIYGTNCEQPMFKFPATDTGDEAGLVDIYYELKFWQAAP